MGVGRKTRARSLLKAGEEELDEVVTEELAEVFPEVVPEAAVTVAEAEAEEDAENANNPKSLLGNLNLNNPFSITDTTVRTKNPS